MRERGKEETCAHAHISRVLRRANARWPGKRRRRGQSSGIESWSHRHIQRLLGSRGRRQDRWRARPSRQKGVYLWSDERKLHISRTFCARPRSERIDLFSVARAFLSTFCFLPFREDLETSSRCRSCRNDEVKIKVNGLINQDWYYIFIAIRFGWIELIT